MNAPSTPCCANPWVFVGGCPRSGTTLLQRMLDGHPELAVANDTHFIVRALEIANPQALVNGRLGQPIPLSAALREAAWDYHRFYRMGLSRAQFEAAAAEAATYQEFVSRLFERFAGSHGKRRAGEKTPDYVLHVPLLLGLFPSARFLHLVRDGRDVALSLLDWATATKGPGRLAHWSADPIATSALWWRNFVETGRRDMDQDDRTLLVHYEALLADLHGQLTRICHHLQLPYVPAIAEFHRGKEAAHGRSAKGQWLPATPGLRDWRRQMTRDDVSVFENIAGAALTAFGYPLAGDPVTSAVRDRVERAEKWWRQPGAKRAARPWPRVPTVVRGAGNGHPVGDAAPVPRDPQIPGLSQVLDPPVLAAILRDRLVQAGNEPGDVTIRIRYVRYKPITNCLVCFEVTCAAQRQVGTAMAYRQDDHAKLDKADRFVQAFRPHSPLALVDPVSRIVVLPFPLDPGLPSLHGLCSDPRDNSTTLAKKLGLPADRMHLTCIPLSYKPLRRCVLRVDGDGAPQGVARLYRPREFQAAKRAAKVLQASAGWIQARRLGQSDRDNAISVEWLDGTPLWDSDTPPEQRQCHATEIGHLLARVHDRPRSKLGTITVEHQLKWLAQSVQMLSALIPQLRERTMRLAGRIEDQLRAAVPHPVRIHGDFHSGQILRSGDRYAIIDWDRAANGPPELDVAAFAGDLLVDNLIHGRSDAARDEIRATVDHFLAAYYRHSSRSRRALPGFLASRLLQLAVTPFRRFVTGWTDMVPQILNFAEDCLAASAGTRTGSEPVHPAITVRHRNRSQHESWLSAPLDPAAVGQRLAPILAKDGGTSPRLTGIHVKKHKPGRRALIEYGLTRAGGDSFRVLGKIRAKGLDRASADVQRRLHERQPSQSAHFEVARYLGAIPEWNLWLQSHLPGRQVTWRLIRTTGPGLCERIGAALAQLHTLQLVVERRHDDPSEISILREHLGQVAEEHPPWKGRIQDIFDGCCERLAANPCSEITGIHRDFHPGQVLVHGHRVQIVDFDLFAMGDPAVDVGNFLAHLQEMAIRLAGSCEAAVPHEQAFVRGYRQVRPAIRASAIAAMTAVSLARHIAISCRIPDRRQATESILAVCEQVIARKQSAMKLVSS